MHLMMVMLENYKSMRVAQGKTAKEIAREAYVSYRTVEGMIAKLMESFGCSSSKELIALFHKQP